MTPIHQTFPLGCLQPEHKHPSHQLQILLRGDNGSAWSTVLTFDTRNSAPRRLLILELPAKVKTPGGIMTQRSDTRSDFAVTLAGPAVPATLRDLTDTPLPEWMSTMYEIFAECPAAIGILVTRGNLSVVLHEGD
jgi:hypothetical protein